MTIGAPGDGSSPITLTLTASPGYNGTVTLTPTSCTITPAGSESSCAFNPSSITGSGTTQVTVNTTAPHASMVISFHLPVGFNRFASAKVVAMACVLLLFFTARKRRWGIALGLILLTGLASFATSCGGISGGGNGGNGGTSDPGTPVGVTYTVSVTVVGNGGQTTHTARFTFVVQ